MKLFKPLIAIGAIALSLTAAAQDEALPDPTLTPGAVRTVDRKEICRRGTAYLRQNTEELRHEVERRYARTTRGMEMDHLIPLGIGGANSADNLWPQPWPEAHKKDRLEWKLRELICREGADPAELQNAIRADWRKAYTDYMVR